MAWGLTIAASALLAVIAGALSSIFGALRTFDGSNSANLTKREAELKQRDLSGLDEDSREARELLKGKCDHYKDQGVGLIWKDPLIGEPLVDEPDEYAFDKFEYYLDNRRVDETETRAYFELPYIARCARCVLSRRELLTARTAK